MSLALVTVIVQLIFLEGVLSLDNAAVLGAMVRPLPSDKPVPWPRLLRWPGRRINRLLGPQRGAALRVGLLGAYIGQSAMLALARYVMENPWLRLVGALYLLYLAINYLGDLKHEESGDHQARARSPVKKSFWAVVLAIEFTDLAFSLDNVVAAVALSDQYWVVLLGVMLAILMIRFAAGIFSRLIDWEPALQHSAYLLILAIGVELILADQFGIDIGEFTQFGISLGILALTVAFARIRWLRPINVIWSPVLTLCFWLQIILHWLAWPIRFVVQLVADRRARSTTSLPRS
jgi:tellurite resistance protein TerC